MERLCAEATAVRAGETLLAAVSGGCDSVALAALLAGIASRNGATLVLAHVNHAVRPDAARDEGVVLGVGAALHARVVVRALSPGPATEAHLREERYAALVSIAREVGASRIFTAHHAGDQTETVLLALFRGTGARGFAGISPTRELAPGILLERPLLAADKAELRAYVGEHRLPYALDASNDDIGYTRNLLRATLPVLRERFPGLDRAVARSVALVTQTSLGERAPIRAELRALLAETTGLRDVSFERVENVARGIEAGRAGRHFIRRGVELVVTVAREAHVQQAAASPTELGDVLFDEAAIAAAVARLARELEHFYLGRTLTLVCVLDGALLFTADLARALSPAVDVRIASVSVSSYDGKESTGSVRLASPLPAGLRDADVLIVEDIADTGRTLAHLRALIEAEAPASLRTCVLFDKPSRRVVATPLDFTGIIVPDAFIVGYGLDHREKYRHLPYVAVLHPEGAARASAPAEHVANSDSRSGRRE